VARLITAGTARTVFGPPAEELLVVGAHRAGQPLSGQLIALGARQVATVWTAPEYRLFRLATHPPKPGLVRVEAGGESIEGELWELPVAGLGAFLAALPEPMTLGRVRLDDGSEPTGFLCEAIATDGAQDITAHGSWLEYLAPASAG
jgi:allophanate hydrolase